jgi:hypothetical protein
MAAVDAQRSTLSEEEIQSHLISLIEADQRTASSLLEDYLMQHAELPQSDVRAAFMRLIASGRVEVGDNWVLSVPPEREAG